MKRHPPSEFPFLGHIGQFWSSYSAVYRATKDGYPFNFGYHVMILVIGTSTTVEYALRSAYETLIGRVSELTQTHGMTEEDRFGARVAQDYVDFIRVRPWYEYDFKDKLVAPVDRNCAVGTGPAAQVGAQVRADHGVRHRRRSTAGSSGEVPRASLRCPAADHGSLLDHLPDGVERELPELKILQRLPDGAVLVTVPRYEAFTRYSGDTRARRERRFREIAGNRGVILVSVLGPGWSGGSEPDGPRVLFTQPILTQPGRKRVALVVPVSLLWRRAQHAVARGDDVEHVFDY